MDLMECIPSIVPRINERFTRSWRRPAFRHQRDTTTCRVTCIIAPTASAMLRLPFRHRRRRGLFHALLILFVIWNAVEVVLIQRHLWHPLAHNNHQLQSPPERIFIASIHWNDEIILRSHWNQALINLVQALGPQNVFVSVYESGSYDNTKDALRALDQSLAALDVPRNITLSNVTHWDEMHKPPADHDWLQTKRGKKELRRIPYLARTRNIGLEPLSRLAEEGVHFDKILFLNDIVFTVGLTSPLDRWRLTTPGQ